MKNVIIFIFSMLPFSGFSQKDTASYMAAAPLGLGLGVNFGFANFQGKLTENFKPNRFSFETTGEVLYKRFIADTEIKFAGTTNSKSITYQNIVFQKKEFEYSTIFNSRFGYDCIKNKKNRLIIFSGLGYGYFDRVEENDNIPNPNWKDIKRKNFFYLSTGIMIDKFIGVSNFKSYKEKSDIRLSYIHPMPSFSWRLKIEYIYPILSQNYNVFQTNIFQVTFGAMLYVHGLKFYSSPKQSGLLFEKSN